jgi:cobalamin-dependent methionine synthase I
MTGMNVVGIYLVQVNVFAQVVKSARVYEKAVAFYCHL